ncbi:MAG: hypothetical protein KGZ81_15980 [Flavobacteriales bacterium]|nr:hypothetical protein [Flavobacteriales bacterium]
MHAFLIFSILYGVIPLLYYYFGKINRLALKEAFPFIVVVFIASVYEFVGTNLLQISYEKWYLKYKILAFVSIHYFFYHLLKQKYRYFFWFYILCFIAIVVINNTLFYHHNYMDKSSYLTVLQTIIVIHFSIAWFYQLFNEMQEENLFQNSNFYIVSGLFICYCGTVYLFLTANHIYTTNKTVFQYYWLLNIVLNLFLRTTLIVAIWKARLK